MVARFRSFFPVATCSLALIVPGPAYSWHFAPEAATGYLSTRVCGLEHHSTPASFTPTYTTNSAGYVGLVPAVDYKNDRGTFLFRVEWSQLYGCEDDWILNPATWRLRVIRDPSDPLTTPLSAMISGGI